MSSQTPTHPFYRNKTVLLTGASRGIGLALAQALSASGAKVWAGCRQPAQAQALQQAAERSGGTLQVLPLDVTDDASVKAFAAAAPARLDVLFNNAGINVDHGEGPAKVPTLSLVKTFDTNTLGPLRTMQLLQPNLAAAKGRVANISSIMGSIGENGMGGSTAYRVSKAALNMLTKNFSLLEDGVIYLALHPGWVQTDMGGERAPVVTSESAAGLLSVVAQATLASSGSFLRFDGQSAPW